MENIIKKWLFARPKEECVKEANAIYQVREYEGEIWLTFNGSIVCPMGMFKEETIECNGRDAALTGKEISGKGTENDAALFLF